MSCFSQPINQFRVNKGAEVRGVAGCKNALDTGATLSLVIPTGAFFVAASFEPVSENLEMKGHYNSAFVGGSNLPSTTGAGGGWHNNYVRPYDEVFGIYEVATMSDTGTALGGYKFPIRRAVNIYKGTTLVDTIDVGDTVMCTGGGTSGESYGDRLFIKAYRKGGVWKEAEWAQTGLREGFKTSASMSIYSTKWDF